MIRVHTIESFKFNKLHFTENKKFEYNRITPYIRIKGVFKVLFNLYFMSGFRITKKNERFVRKINELLHENIHFVGKYVYIFINPKSCMLQLKFEAMDLFDLVGKPFKGSCVLCIGLNKTKLRELAISAGELERIFLFELFSLE